MLPLWPPRACAEAIGFACNVSKIVCGDNYIFQNCTMPRVRWVPSSGKLCCRSTHAMTYGGSYSIDGMCLQRPLDRIGKTKAEVKPTPKLVSLPSFPFGVSRLWYGFMLCKKHITCAYLHCIFIGSGWELIFTFITAFFLFY